MDLDQWRIHSQHAVRHARTMSSSVTSILHSELWLGQILDWMLLQPFGVLKDVSHNGAVWFPKRKTYRGCGNYIYSLLYQHILRASKGTDLESKFLKLGDRYATLSSHAEDSTTALGKQGDVIEVMLAIIRETGPAVPRRAPSSHSSWHAYQELL